MYPRVLSEEQTIAEMVSGAYRGIARFGDGDFNIMRGQRDRYHKPCPKLAAALAQVLRDGSSQVLSCLIPPPHPSVKDGNLAYQRWVNYLDMNAGILPFLKGGIYGSSNISRMDSCPHLHTTSWWTQITALWRGRDICLVSGSERSLTAGKLMSSPGAPASVTQVPCKAQDNFSQIDEIHAQVLAAGKEHVVLCAGLLSRPLVYRLVADGFYAYDMGHLGLWFQNGHPIPLPDCLR